MEDVTTLKRLPEVVLNEEESPDAKVKRVKEEEKSTEKEQKRQEKERKLKEKQAEKERKQQEKQAEKDQREAGKRKKEASQSRINRWFLSARPTNADSTPQDQTPDPNLSSNSYRRIFLAYEPKNSAKLWPTSAKEQSPDDSMEWLASLRQPSGDSRWLSTSSFSQKVSTPACDGSELTDLLGKIRVRHLQFSENTRPPFIGTVVDLSRPTRERIAKYPWERACEFLDYSYDSENEWVAEDGEDLGDEDEDDAGEEVSDDDSLKDFVAADGEDEGVSGRSHEALKPIVLWSRPGEPVPQELAAWKIEFLQPLAKKEVSKSGSDTKEDSTPVDPSKVDINPEDLRQILLRIQNSSDSKVYWKETLAKEFTSISKSKLEVVFKSFAEREGRLGPWRIKPEAGSQLGI